MDLNKINQSFIQLVQELQANKAVEVLAVSYPTAAESTDMAHLQKLKLPLSILAYFETMNGCRLSWQNRVQTTTLVKGSLALLPAAEATKHWNKAIYFDDDTRAAKRTFYPIDQFADEACCGVFGDGKNEHLHYYAFNSGEEPYDLQLTIEQYISTAIAAKCYYFWPLILKLIVEKTDSPLIQKMNDDMAVLFPDFSMERWAERPPQPLQRRGLCDD